MEKFIGEKFIGRFKKGLMAAAIAFIVATTAAPALAFEASGEAGVDLMSTYVWRGQNLGQNEGVVQPTVGISYNNFSVNLWANYDSELGEVTETDYTLSYSREMEGFSLEAGYIYYAIDDAVDTDTSELYLGVALDAPLSPSATLYWDIDKGEGAFLVVAVEHSLPLPRDLELTLGASASVNFDNDVMGFDSSGDDFTDLYNGELSASVTIPLAENITITPKVSYSDAISSDAEDAIEAISSHGESDILYGGVSLALSF